VNHKLSAEGIILWVPTLGSGEFADAVLLRAFGEVSDDFGAL
jgi:hypothetical protein